MDENVDLKQAQTLHFFKVVMVFVKKLNVFPSIVLMQSGSIKRILKSSKTKRGLI